MSNSTNNLQAILILKNGHIFVGRGIGIESSVYGECVFTTGMTGYNESLTDPSYAGQILCFTYPLIGNYGTSMNWYESTAMFAQGLIISNLSEGEFHSDNKESLESFLCNSQKSGIVGVDTRMLTKILRTEGNQNSILVTGNQNKINEVLNKFQQQGFESLLPSVNNPQDIGYLNWPERVNSTNIYVQKENPLELKQEELKQEINSKTTKNKIVVVLDCGVKGNIIKELQKRIQRVIVVDAKTSINDILKLHPDGILLSNGPGDPRDYDYIVDTTKLILHQNIPLMGICLGHQILSMAIGADIYKMKFGNRGGNQPVQDLNNNKAYLTSQNHGYATVESSIPSTYKVFFKNLNDGTIEGIEAIDKPVFSVQFHPEASSGPHDTNWLFDKFVESL